MKINFNKSHCHYEHFLRHYEHSEAILSRMSRLKGLAKTEQSGRTLVETLSVLAIIGVLSVVGVACFTWAINKHKANQLLEGINQRATMVSAQIQQGNSTQLTSASCGETQTLAFVYNNDLSSEDKTNSEPCPSANQQRVDGECCDKDKIYDNNTKCCTKALCNNQCCPTTTPICSANQCVECATDSDCKSANKLYCDTTTHTCQGEGYVRVEYLKSSGTQWINTGVYPKMDNYKVQVVGIKDTNYSIFGSGLYGIVITGADEVNYAYYNGKKILGFPKTFDNHAWIMENNSWYLDVTLMASATSVSTATASLPICLFGRCKATNTIDDAGSHTLYSAKLWNNGSLVRDMIPCYRKSDNEPGMYDKVNNVFYDNDGTGSFAIGPELE